MPLDTHNEAVASWIFDGLNEPVTCPCCRHQFPSHGFNSLVMVTVHGYAFGACQLAKQTAVGDANHMRRPVARRALLVFDRVGVLASNVLNQGATARDIQRL